VSMYVTDSPSAAATSSGAPSSLSLMDASNSENFVAAYSDGTAYEAALPTLSNTGLMIVGHEEVVNYRFPRAYEKRALRLVA
jgi:hypothetical protein